MVTMTERDPVHCSQGRAVLTDSAAMLRAVPSRIKSLWGTTSLFNCDNIAWIERPNLCALTGYSFQAMEVKSASAISDVILSNERKVQGLTPLISK